LSSGRLWGAGCFTALSVPFAVGGVLGAAVLVQHLFGWVTTRGYVPAQCVIDHAELKEAGGDGPGYEALTRYHYAFGGRTFAGARAHFGWGGDSFAFHRELYESLEAHRRSGAAMACFVDPAHPEHSVINRDFRFGLAGLGTVFAVIFGGVGFAGLRLAWDSLRRRP
jgi:hypothetical protein